MSTPTVIADSQGSLNKKSVETMSQRANLMSEQNRMSWVERGMRIVRDREPKVMRILEQAAELMGEINEEQYGETQRRKSHRGTSLGVQATDTSLWQEAFRLADEGKPSIHFGWLYAAAAERAGFAFS